LGDQNPTPQLLEFKHLSGDDGPNLKDRRKATIEQIHFLKLTQKTGTNLKQHRISVRKCRHGTGQQISN
jgi:hypothetical protein